MQPSFACRSSRYICAGSAACSQTDFGIISVKTQFTNQWKMNWSRTAKRTKVVLFRLLEFFQIITKLRILCLTPPPSGLKRKKLSAFLNFIWQNQPTHCLELEKPSACRISLSWWGNTRSSPPEWMSSLLLQIELKTWLECIWCSTRNR